MTNLISSVSTRACTVAVFSITVASCSGDNIVGDLEKRYPTEIESCVCRFLAFQADSYTRVTYDEMLSHCNEITRRGHPSLPDDIKSEPAIDTLRCDYDVEDWKQVVSDEVAQQASNRKNYEELISKKKDPTDK